MSLLAKSRKEGQIQHITPQSAGWRYIGFDVWMLKKGQTVTLESGEMKTATVRWPEGQQTVSEFSMPTLG